MEIEEIETEANLQIELIVRICNNDHYFFLCPRTKHTLLISYHNDNENKERAINFGKSLIMKRYSLYKIIICMICVDCLQVIANKVIECKYRLKYAFTVSKYW